MSNTVLGEDGGSTRPWVHWPLAVIIGLAAVLTIARLGHDYLWSDEGDTAFLASTILEYGVPKAWDGVSLIDSDAGKRLNDDLVMVSHPWLQYYVTAASFAVLGKTAFAARLPFALLGLATIGLVYALVYRATRNRWAAATGAMLLVCSVQFLLYMRQSRYYTLNAALTCLLVMQFLRLRRWRDAVLFALIGILLFHSHPVAIAPLAAMAVLTLMHPAFAGERPWFWRAVPIIAVFTLPWLVVARSGYSLNMEFAGGIEQFARRFAQFAVECASITSLPAAVCLLVIAAIVAKGQNRGAKARRRGGQREAAATLFTSDEWRLVVALAAVLTAYGVVMAVTQSRDALWSLGVRYTPAVIPFAVILATFAIARLSRGRRWVWVSLVLLFGLTRFDRVTPWVFWQRPAAMRDPAATVSFHNPSRAIDRYLRTAQIAFVQSLVQENQGTTARVATFLNDHASPGDVVLTNYGWESLYFHTKLPLAMTVLPSYPIYGAAKAQGLPDYVFRPDGARWIVWRRAWGAYRGQDLNGVLAQFGDAGVPTTLVATLPETLWENRENLHFRRFPGNRYIFPWYEHVPDAVIYRVDRQGVPRTGGGAGATP